MKLVITREGGAYVSAEQHARVTAAIEAELATSKYTFADAILAWAEHVDLMEIVQQKQDLTQDQSELDERHRFELTDADRKFLATPDKDLVTWQPDHDERVALWLHLNEVAREAAGEMVWFYDEEGEYGSMEPLQAD